MMHVEHSTNFKRSILDILNARTLSSIVICSILSSTYYQFLTLSNQFLTTRFGQTEIEAKNLVTIFIIETIITTPIFGSLVTKIGQKPLFLLISSILAASSFITMFFLPEEKSNLIHIPIFLLSQFFALFNTVIWPTMMISVPSRSVGICLGIGTLMESSLMSILPVIFGFVLEDKTIKSFQSALLAFSGITILGVFLCYWLWKFDRRNDKLLLRRENDPVVQRLRREMAIQSDKSSGDSETETRSGEDSGSSDGEINEVVEDRLSKDGVFFKKRERTLSGEGNGVLKGNLIEKLEEKAEGIVGQLDISVIAEN